MMDPLPHGERLVRCLIGEPIDRVPYGVGVGWCPWPQTVERWRRETGKEDLDHRVEFDTDPGFLELPIELGIWPAFERETVEETDEHILFRDEKGILQKQRRDGGSMPEFLDYPVKTQDDWEQLKTERLDPDAPGRLDEVNWDEVRRLRDEDGYRLQVGRFPFGVFGTPRDLLGVEELLMGFYDQPEMIRDMMNHLTDLWLALWSKVADEVPIDHVHIWEDMSGRQGSLLSPAMVEQFMMPCYDRIADFCRARGVRIMSVDTDGLCDQLADVFVRHGVNMMFPFEVQAGNDVREYRRRLGQLGIMGGLDKRAIARDRQAVDAEIDRAAETLKLGRYVPGFDHLIPPDVPWELFAYAAGRLKELCYRTTNPQPAG